MDAEIELKLFMQSQYHDLLVKLLNGMSESTPQNTRELSNKYFDTAALQLRRWKMGLRVRSSENFTEQTIKTAGSVIGGIHTRPEYNVPIEQKIPSLNLFPKDIWPNEADIDGLQQDLHCVFETNFTRQAWHIYIEGSLVEVAFDVGEVLANGESEPICEIEFELLAGEASALLHLAIEVARTIPVRLGKASKAQRGYQLSGHQHSAPLEKIDYICLPTDKSLPKTLEVLLETGIERWQIIESLLIETRDIPHQAKLWMQLRACVRLLRLTLSQFGLLNKQVLQYFELIEQQMQFIEPLQSLSLILDEQKKLLGKRADKTVITELVMTKVTELVSSHKLAHLWQVPEYGQLQLSLVDLLLKTTNGSHQMVDYPELGLFANHLQQDSWQKIVNLMPVTAAMDSLDYQKVAQRLDESILVGFAYGELYQAEDREAFRAPWQDLALGIQTLGSYQLLSEITQDSDVDIASWLEAKEQSLLFAMEHSRKSALGNQPYWK
ncbi:CYTH domain-containing protein [Shewanella sp. 1_MG-2023]|uniref:CYTH domain-containing protein n=1 Tax=unclassified Shewanella TaxID=196818 RepID=UPI0026E2B7AB|nr:MULTISPECIES: CYTH domain-containing protein [unclassified Shewanella]MDO6611452.1 CYTH domain-containing protein [Shewanella sp. 7_MG-2023]MDO6771307.1 CYTH domain-containing protein [Shewanella sp. 2_MG-2023]MDO6793533.1 CYTH domain-containing protein [Shewanella sp. 1_MG-2023]